MLEKMCIKQQESRTPEQLKKQYEIEKALASRLKNSNRYQRTVLYGKIYKELYSKFPEVFRKTNLDNLSRDISIQLNILKPFINKKTTFLEIGSGDCKLSFEMAKYVKRVIAIDVSWEFATSEVRPLNFILIVSDGLSIDVQQGIVDVAFSNQLIEHLHPDDAAVELKNIYKALVPGGVYVCITPHRFSGPHDISKYFDEVASGLHLKEYTYSDLSSMFKEAGFSKIYALVGARGMYVPVPLKPLILLENLLDIMPKAIKRALSHTLILRLFLGIKVVARK
jgi:SAM-dependent methyltransferase